MLTSGLYHTSTCSRTLFLCPSSPWDSAERCATGSLNSLALLWSESWFGRWQLLMHEVPRVSKVACYETIDDFSYPWYHFRLNSFGQGWVSGSGRVVCYDLCRPSSNSFAWTEVLGLWCCSDCRFFRQLCRHLQIPRHCQSIIFAVSGSDWSSRTT